jgi:hypothetical protein
MSTIPIIFIAGFVLMLTVRADSKRPSDCEDEHG